MNLLPNIDLDNGNVLSCQDPFTLNGCLILEINYNEQDVYTSWYNSYTRELYRSERYISIKNDRGDVFRCTLDWLEQIYNRVIQQNRGIRFVNDYGLITPFVDFNSYIHCIQEQCDLIGSSYDTITFLADDRNVYAEMIRRLKRQERGERYGDSILYRERCDATASISWNSEGIPVAYGSRRIGTIPSDYQDRISIDYSRDYLGEWQPLNATVVTATLSKKYIHQYNYKPEYIKYRLPGEDSLLLGAEIEVDCGGESEEHAKAVLEIMCGSDPNDPDDVLEDKMFCTHDGSLKNGIEFDTMPCTLEYHKTQMNYREMFEYLDKHGYKAHDTSTCGLHVHADRSYLGKSVLMQQLNISKILYILEKFNDEICVIARRNNSYSRFVGSGKDENSVIELYEKYKNQDKHVALNLKHEDTIEFRCFKGTLKYETFILTLEFVKDIIDYAKSINIEEIELIQWKDLMNTFSDELKAYYEERLEKEKNKKVTATATLSTTTLNANGRVYATDAAGHRLCAFDLASPVTVSSYNRPSSDITFTHEDMDRLYRQMCTATVGSFSESNRVFNLSSADENPIKRKKKEIKDLNKQIRNSGNYLERTRLKQQLAEAQKELKKLKRNRQTNH